MAKDTKTVEQLSIETIRTLAMDAVQQANAGHPGTAMALAPVAYVLYRDVMRANPSSPDWPDRDRFVLSAGHACILQYAALHLTGYNLALEEIKRFRQWESLTPGHPEHFLTPGIETTTGPLGQGISNAVGMAMAEKFLGQRYNRPGHTVVDHCVYGIASDGDLMEGVSQEAASLAGAFGLGKLIFFYDDNRITIDGTTALSFDSGTRAGGSRPTAGMSSTSPTSMTSPRFGARSRTRRRRTSARRSSSYAATSPTRPRTPRTRRRRTALPWGRTRCARPRRSWAGIPTRTSSSRTRSTST